MVDFKEEKKLILEYFNSIDDAKSENLIDSISKYTSDNFKMKCTHPFNELNGVNQVANNLWVPIKNSFEPIQRRMDIFSFTSKSRRKHLLFLSPYNLVNADNG